MRAVKCRQLVLTLVPPREQPALRDLEPGLPAAEGFDHLLEPGAL